jgi:hypothetical protein
MCFIYITFLLIMKNKFIQIIYFYIPVPTSLFYKLQKNILFNEIHTNS